MPSATTPPNHLLVSLGYPNASTFSAPFWDNKLIVPAVKITPETDAVLLIIWFFGANSSGGAGTLRYNSADIGPRFVRDFSPSVVQCSQISRACHQKQADLYNLSVIYKTHLMGLHDVTRKALPNCANYLGYFSEPPSFTDWLKNGQHGVQGNPHRTN